MFEIMDFLSLPFLRLGRMKHGNKQVSNRIDSSRAFKSVDSLCDVISSSDDGDRLSLDKALQVNWPQAACLFVLKRWTICHSSTCEQEYVVPLAAVDMEEMRDWMVLQGGGGGRRRGRKERGLCVPKLHRCFPICILEIHVTFFLLSFPMSLMILLQHLW